MAAPRVVLETARLVLREIAPGDLDFLVAMLGDPEVMRFYPRVLDRAGAEAWLARTLARYRDDGHAFWLAVEKETGAPVGQVGVLAQTVQGERLPEVGYLLHRPFWKRGFATEAAIGCRDWAFEHRRARVISLIRPENLASAAVAARMGMRIASRTVHAGLDHDVWSIERAR